MLYCLQNKIITPDGTTLWCKSGHDYQTHVDAVSGEVYMNDSCGYYVRRSVNDVMYTDVSVWADTDDITKDYEVTRTAKFWRSYGPEGEYYPDGVMLSVADMQDEHICAILRTQKQVQGNFLEQLFKYELVYRKENPKE